MMNTQEKICRLCFSNAPDDFEVVDSNTTDKIGIVLPDLNLDIFGNSLLCTKCSVKLSQAFAFKSSCLEIEDNIHNYTNNGQIQVNLEKILGLMDIDDNLDDYENMMRRNMKICRTCLDIVEMGSFTSLDGYENHLMNHILQKCLPELDHHLTKDPGICDKCKHSASSTSDFISQCMDLEAKIMDYVKLELPENFSINNAFKYVFHEKEGVLLLNSDVTIINQETEEIFTIDDDSTEYILDCSPREMDEKQEYKNEISTKMRGDNEANTPDTNLDMRQDSNVTIINQETEKMVTIKDDSTKNILDNNSREINENPEYNEVSTEMVGVNETNTPDTNLDMRQDSNVTIINQETGKMVTIKDNSTENILDSNSREMNEKPEYNEVSAEMIGVETNTLDTNLDMRQDSDALNNCQPEHNENTRKRKYDPKNSISETTKQNENTPQEIDPRSHIIISDDEDTPIRPRRYNPKRSSRITTRIIDSDDDVLYDPDFRPESYHDSESDDPDYEYQDQTRTPNSTQRSKQRKIIPRSKNKTEKRRKKEEPTKGIVYNNNSYFILQNNNSHSDSGQPLYHLVLAPEMTRHANNPILIDSNTGRVLPYTSGSSLQGTVLFSGTETMSSPSTSVRVPTGLPMVAPQTLPTTCLQQFTPIMSMPQYSSVQPGNYVHDMSSGILSIPGTNSETFRSIPGNMNQYAQTSVQREFIGAQMGVHQGSSVTTFQQNSLFSYDQRGSFIAGPSNMQAYAPNMTTEPMAPVQAASSITEVMQPSVINNNNALLTQQTSLVRRVPHSTSIAKNKVGKMKMGLPIQQTPVITKVNPTSCYAVDRTSMNGLAQSTLITGKPRTSSLTKVASSLISRNASFRINNAKSDTIVKPRSTAMLSKTPSINKVNPARSMTKANQIKSITKVNMSTSITKFNPAKSITKVNQAKSMTKVNPTDHESRWSVINPATSILKANQVISISEVNPTLTITKFNPATSLLKLNPAKSINKVKPTKSITVVNPISITKVDSIKSITEVKQVTKVDLTALITEVDPVRSITGVDPVTSITEVNHTNSISEVDQTTVTEVDPSSITKVNIVTPITEVDLATPIIEVDPATTSITEVDSVTSVTEVNPVTSITDINPVTSNTEVNPGTSITEVNPGTSITEVNPATSVTEVDPTSIAKVDPVKPITEDDPATSIPDVNPITSVTEVNPITSINKVNPVTSIAEIDQVTLITEVNPPASITEVDQETPIIEENRVNSITGVDPVTSITDVDPATPISEVNPAISSTDVDRATPITEVNPATSMTEVDAATPIIEVNQAAQITDNQSGTEIVSESSAQCSSIGGKSVEQLTCSISPIIAGNESVEMSNTVDDSRVTLQQNTPVTEDDESDLRTSEQQLSVTDNVTVSLTASGTATQSMVTGDNNTTARPNSPSSLFMYLTAPNTGDVNKAVKSTAPYIQKTKNGNSKYFILQSTKAVALGKNVSAQVIPALNSSKNHKPKNRAVNSSNSGVIKSRKKTHNNAYSGLYATLSKAKADRYSLNLDNRSKLTSFYKCINCGFEEQNKQLYSEHKKKCRILMLGRNKPTKMLTFDLDSGKPLSGVSDKSSEKSELVPKKEKDAGSEVLAESGKDQLGAHRLAPILHSRLQPEQKGLAVLKCDLCSFNARTYLRIEEHIHKHISELGKDDIYQCDVCQDCFTTIENISNHLKYTHNLDYYKLYYWCVKCATIFNKPLELNDHFPQCLFKDKVVRLFKSNDIIFCLLCEFETTDLAEARTHLRSCRITNVVVSDEVIEID